MATVRLYSGVPLNPNDENRILTNAATLLADISDKKVEEFVVSYIKGGAVEIPVVAYDIIDCNYLSYTQGDRTHFCFIDSVEWRSVKSSVVYFTEDYFTTYASEINFKSCNLIRTNSLSRGGEYATIIESDFIPKHYAPAFSTNFVDAFDYDSSTEFWSFLVYAKTIAGKVGFYQPHFPTSPIPTIFNVFLCDTADDVRALSAYFFATLLIEADDVIQCFAVPRVFTSELPVYDYPIGNERSVKILFDDYQMPIEHICRLFPNNINFNNYRQLWRSSLSYVEVNLFGHIITFNPEDISDEMEFAEKFAVRFSVSDVPSLAILLPNKNTRLNFQNTQAHSIYPQNCRVLCAAEFPSIALTKSTFEENLIPSAIGLFSSLITSKGTSFVSSTVNFYQGLISSMQNSSVTMAQPNTPAYNGAMQLYVRFITITPSEYERFSKFISRYGYIYNTIIDGAGILETAGGVRTVSGGVVEDKALYIKIKDFVILGNVPNIAKAEIKSALENGARIFKNISDMESDL